MALVVLAQVAPFNPATAAETPVRLAGGGSRAYDQLGFLDWRGGLANLPRYTTALGFDQVGWTGGAVPQTAALRFFPSDGDYLSTLANLKWEGARITITTGDDATGAYAPDLTGIVAGVTVEGGAISITVSDLSGDLSKTVLPDTFAGTGLIEGGDDATGRVKRRTWGAAFDVEGFLLVKAYNVYEFGDPGRPLDAFVTVRDKGRAGPLSLVPWQGSIAATLATLCATEPPQGGAAVAPSIACVKWWTQPSGPITADIRGEAGDGYVQTAAAIAARIVGSASTAITFANLPEAIGWQSATAGIHAADASETAGQLLDRLLSPLSLIWTLGPTGALTFSRWSWTAPVETLVSDTVTRQTVYAPLKTRKVGFKRNYRPHSDGEISAAILAGEVTFQDGQTLQALQPGEAGATYGAPTGSPVAGRSAETVVSSLDGAIENIAAEVMRSTTWRGESDQIIYTEDGTPVRTVVEAVGVTVDGHQAYIAFLQQVGGDGTAKATFTVRGDGGLVGWETISGPGDVNQFSFVASRFLFIDDSGNNPVNALLYENGVWKLRSVEAETITYGSLVPKFGGTFNLISPDGGYQMIPGGLIFQWGRYRGQITDEQSFSILFNIPFPNAVMAVTATPYIGTASNLRDLWLQNLGPPSLQGASFYTQSSTKNNQNLDGFDWIAFGN